MKSKNIVIAVFLIVFSLSGLFSLVFAQKIEIIDGVKHIHNDKPQWGKKPKVTLEYLRRIGELYTEDENYQFYRPNSVVRDEGGNIYILETGNNRVQKFDAEGKYLLTIGRKGQGPGELEMPIEMEINNKGHIYVHNFSNMRMQKYTGKGEDLGSFVYPRISSFGFLKSGELVAQIIPRWVPDQKPDIKKHNLLSIINPEGELQKEFGKLEGHREWQIAGFMNWIEITTDSEDFIYITFCFENRIEKYSPEETLIFTMTRPLNYKIEHKMVKREYNIEGKVSVRDVMKMTRVSGYIGVDYKDRIWIITYLKQPESLDEAFFTTYLGEFEIFDRSGILLGKLPVPARFSKIRITGDRLYGIETVDEVCVYEYKIVDE